MKRLLIVTLALMMLLSACANSSSTIRTIRVTGYYLIIDKEATAQKSKETSTPEYIFKEVPNLKFTGSYMVVSPNGQSISKSVDGTTPQEYTVQGGILSSMFQKLERLGYLKVEILDKDGNPMASEYTFAEYGIVSLVTP